MTALRLWVGHMFDDPPAWFVVAAPTRDEALWVADELGQIDTRSLHEISEPFAMLVGSRVVDVDGEKVVAFGNDEMGGDAAVYWTDDAAERWATSLLREPLTGDDEGMIDSAAEASASQQRVRLKKPSSRTRRD